MSVKSLPLLYQLRHFTVDANAVATHIVEITTFCPVTAHTVEAYYLVFLFAVTMQNVVITT